MISSITRKAAAAVAVAATLSAFGASAGATTISGAVTHPAGATFSDSHPFSLSGISNVGTLILGFNFAPYFGTDLTSVSVSGPASYSWSGHSTSGLSFSLPGSPGGDYSLNIGGTTSSTAIGGGGYSYTLSISPVPEPGEWAMLLAGLGVIGMVARRRSRAG
jgi:hypothetical protein